jgi:hypothetical protein
LELLDGYLSRPDDHLFDKSNVHMHLLGSERSVTYEDPSMDHCFEGTCGSILAQLIAGVSDPHIGQTLHCHAHVKL